MRKMVLGKKSCQADSCHLPIFVYFQQLALFGEYCNLMQCVADVNDEIHFFFEGANLHKILELHTDV